MRQSALGLGLLGLCLLSGQAEARLYDRDIHIITTDYDLVDTTYIDRGRLNGVKVGDKFAVKYRDGKNATQVVVTGVYERMASVKIIDSMMLKDGQLGDFKQRPMVAALDVRKRRPAPDITVGATAAAAASTAPAAAAPAQADPGRLDTAVPEAPSDLPADGGLPAAPGDLPAAPADGGLPAAPGDLPAAPDAGLPAAPGDLPAAPDAGLPEAPGDLPAAPDAGLPEAPGDLPPAPDGGLPEAPGDPGLPPM